MRFNETSAGKKAEARHHTYRKGEFKERGKEEVFRPKFRISYKELIGIPAMAEKLRFPQKADKNLGERKDIWCEFHKGFEHGVERFRLLVGRAFKGRFLERISRSRPRGAIGRSCSEGPTTRGPRPCRVKHDLGWVF